MPLLEVQELAVSYDGREFAIDDVSFSVDGGEVMALVGPNGSGKTTALKAIVGVIDSMRGEVRVGGEEPRGKIVYVPQRTAVDWDFPMTVRDVVKQGRFGSIGWFKRLTKTEDQRVDEALNMVGIKDLEARQIGELSGGQQQRTFLARALAQDGDVYLMDEPFQGVDAATEKAIVSVIHNLRDAGHAVVIVHHDLSTIREYFDTILLINKTVIAQGNIDDVFTAENLQRAYGGKLTVLEQGSVVL